MGRGKFYMKIPGEYRHEKGVPQQGGGADNNWNSPMQKTRKKHQNTLVKII